MDGKEIYNSLVANSSNLLCTWYNSIKLIGASLSEPHLDELAGELFWYIYIYMYIYIYICIHGQSIWSRVGPL